MREFIFVDEAPDRRSNCGELVGGEVNCTVLRELVRLTLQLSHRQAVALQQRQHGKAAGKRTVAVSLVPPLRVKGQRPS